MPNLQIPLNAQPNKDEDGIVLVDNLGCDLINGYVSGFSALHRRPGNKPFANLNIDTVLGVYHWEVEDLLVVVSGFKIYTINRYGTVKDITGATLQDKGRVSFAEDYDFFYAANGGKVIAYAPFLQYLQENIDHPDLAERSIDGNIGELLVDYDYTDTTIYMPDEHAPTKVTHLNMIDTYMIMNNKGDDYITYSEVSEPLNVNALNYIRAETKSDVVKAVAVASGEIIAFGSKSIEFWENIGDPPFARIGGLEIDRGISGADTLCSIAGGFSFIDHERKHVFLNGREVKVLSTEFDKELHRLNVDDAFSMSLGIDGNAWQAISFPSNDKTYVYDHKLGRWQGEWASWDSAKGDYTRWRGNCYTYIPSWGKHLIGDISNGTIYEIRSDYYKDGNDPIRFQWTSGHVSHGTQRTKASNRLMITLKRGSATVPSQNNKCRLTWRDDNKQEWSNGREIDLGNVGDTEMVKTLHALGQYKNRQYRLEYSDEADFIITKIEEEVDLLDR